MLRLKDILGVCHPDWVYIGKSLVNANRDSIPEEALDMEVKEITGFDDGLTVELFYGSAPCVDLPVGKGRKK